MATAFLLSGAGSSSASISSLSHGEVVVAIEGGRYKIFSNDGELLGAITEEHDSYDGSCAFHPAGDRLYTTDTEIGEIVVHDTVFPFEDVDHLHEGNIVPFSVVFFSDGGYLVLNAFTNEIARFDDQDQYVRSYLIPDDVNGAQPRSIDLASDGRTLFFTRSYTDAIFRYDLDTESMLPNFATIPTSYSVLKLLPGNGGLLLAHDNELQRFNSAGAVIREYDSPGEDSEYRGWSSVALDPDGTSFWAGASSGNSIYRFNLATGELEDGPIAVAGSVVGLCVAPSDGSPQETNCSNAIDDDDDDVVDCDDVDCAGSPTCDSYCARPCGKPASRYGNKPLASDALFTLREAVGITHLCLPCECDVDGSGMIAATDALTILRLVVGVSIPLHCPVCGPTASNQAFERGRMALEFQDLTWANRQFGCAVDARQSNAAAQFFYAMTRVLVYVDEDPDLRDLLEELGGDGLTDVFQFTMSFPDGADVPTIAQAKPVVLDGLAAELGAAIENLEKAIADDNFDTTITGRMSPGDLFRTTGTELDAADAAVLSSSYRMWRCFLYATIGAYHASTFDLLHDGIAETVCESSFVGSHTQFFTIASAAAMAMAKSECAGAVDDTIEAYDLMNAETDSQSDDLLVLDEIITPEDPRDLRELLVEFRQSFNAPESDIPACDNRPFEFQFGRLFDAPLTRADLPDLSYDELEARCVVDEESFPDLGFNGLLPQELPVDELGQLLFSDSENWPFCKSVDIPFSFPPF